jgi:hypothetical protein
MNLFWLIMFAAMLPLAVVLSTFLAGQSLQKVKLWQQTVTVKGYAEHPITSDRAIWSASIVERDVDRTRAYAKLDRNRAIMLGFLSDRGFSPELVSFGPVEIDPVFKRNDRGYSTNDIEAYTLKQKLTITSNDVSRVAITARDAGGLIAHGIELQAEEPNYLYTQLDAMKLEMLQHATANARERATRLVEGSGNRLGDLRSASQGVFQVTPAWSTDVSDSGYSDTSSIDKSIKAVVTVEYAIR